MPIDLALRRQLEHIVGPEAVLWRREELLVYAFDGTIERALPRAVVLPATTEEVAAVVRACRDAGVPVTPRGAGTGLSGGAVPYQESLVLSTARMNRILEVDPVDQVAVVQPGVTNLAVSEAAAPYGLFYAPDPSSQRACTIGGNVAENAGGPHCLALGVTTNHVLGLEVVTAAGDVVWLGGRTRESLGYDLRGAFVGSEGTLGIATTIVLRLLPKPPAVATLLASFPSIEAACEAVSAIIARGVLPSALEMLDEVTIEAVQAGLQCGYPPDARAVLLIEVEGTEDAVSADAEEVRRECLEFGATEVRAARDAKERELLWRGRKGAIGALGALAPNYYILDGVVPRSRLAGVMAEVRRIGGQFGFRIANVFHAGDGNLHPCVLFNDREPGARERVLAAGAEIMRLCVDAGGTLTGEHGIGLEKRAFLPWVYSAADIENMERLKEAFGNDGRFNPCKAFPTGTGCGEMAHYPSALRAAGSDAYV